MDDKLAEALGFWNGHPFIEQIKRHIEDAGYIIVPKEPNLAMKRALLVHRGYDPDAKEETLDQLGQLDIATMGSFLAAYRAMVKAASDDAALPAKVG